MTEKPQNIFSIPVVASSILPDGNGGYTPCPEVLTEEELIIFLRIPLISKANNYHNVIENLKRMHDLPCIHLCKKPLYPLNAVRKWIEDKMSCEMK